MDIVFVGAGRLATNLARALKDAGHHIVAVYSRTMTSAVALSDVVGGMPTDNIEALPMEADVFILCCLLSLLSCKRAGKGRRSVIPQGLFL